MPSGGTLRVALRETDGPQEGAIFSISDNGVGISQENLPRVFEAFFTTRNSVGTGIGLFVAKQFIEGHGGRIKIESSQDPDRHGTTVSVFLPRHTLYEETDVSNAVLVDALPSSA
jgi:signal transduction histidine kinase